MFFSYILIRFILGELQPFGKVCLVYYTRELIKAHVYLGHLWNRITGHIVPFNICKD